MAYRNGTYVAFDGQATTNPTQSDMKYYGLLQKWSNNSSSTLTLVTVIKRPIKSKILALK